MTENHSVQDITAKRNKSIEMLLLFTTGLTGFYFIALVSYGIWRKFIEGYWNALDLYTLGLQAVFGIFCIYLSVKLYLLTLEKMIYWVCLFIAFLGYILFDAFITILIAVKYIPQLTLFIPLISTVVLGITYVLAFKTLKTMYGVRTSNLTGRNKYIIVYFTLLTLLLLGVLVEVANLILLSDFVTSTGVFGDMLLVLSFPVILLLAYVVLGLIWKKLFVCHRGEIET